VNGRRIVSLAAIVFVFMPICVVVYQLTVAFVGFAAEPVIAPVGPMVIIDHFHTEAFLEAAFLGVGLAVQFPRRVVWAVGALVIPAVPVLLNSGAYLAAGEPQASLRPFSQDAALWLVEGVSAGLVACSAWELASRVRFQGRSAS
jgi:hypothetical protein